MPCLTGGRRGFPEEASFLELHGRDRLLDSRRDKNAEGRPQIDATVMPARFPEGNPGGRPYVRPWAPTDRAGAGHLRVPYAATRAVMPVASVRGRSSVIFGRRSRNEIAHSAARKSRPPRPEPLVARASDPGLRGL